MHPSLAPHLHGDCLEIIQQLYRCHEQHPVGKFLGECNDIKRALNRCVKEEVFKSFLSDIHFTSLVEGRCVMYKQQDLRKRRRNQEDAKRRRKTLKDLCSAKQE
ncbi:unnamed protein product [Porites lobata]|uniref:COX assembly mitochondrial protein n=1 Tax=Porites lobata TaxID=104759 RepID=A0ABN8QBF3_9CNID|nr:unnamed protein product [Porites lobata]